MAVLLKSIFKTPCIYWKSQRFTESNIYNVWYLLDITEIVLFVMCMHIIKLDSTLKNVH